MCRLSESAIVPAICPILRTSRRILWSGFFPTPCQLDAISDGRFGGLGLPFFLAIPDSGVGTLGQLATLELNPSALHEKELTDLWRVASALELPTHPYCRAV